MRPLLCQPILTILLLLLIAGCGRVEPEPPKEPSPQAAAPIRSLVILPAIPLLEESVPSANRHQLEKGTEVLDTLLAEHYQGMESVTIIPEERREALTTDYGDRLETLRLIGKRLGADAVLQMITERYYERQGTTYSVESPASVAFQYRLIRVSSGETICQGRFDETQQPLTENIFAFPKVARRGLKWLTAPELTKEGLFRKLEECEQLKRLHESDS